MLTVPAWLILAVAGTIVVWIGSGLLERSSERLALYYGLPPVVRGAVVVAVGSSFPELSTAVLSAAVHGAFELGVAAVVGSALFNVLVIPGLSGLVGPGGIAANRDLVYKEAQFYMLAVSALLLTFAFAVIHAPVGIGPGDLRGELTRPVVLLPLGLYALYIFVQWLDTADARDVPPRHTEHPGREWLRLGASLVLILVGVEGLVRAALGLGEALRTPDFLWGVTVVAAGTSVPDAFVSVRSARRGDGVTSLANVLGSNTFDLLVCLPAGVLVAGTAVVDFGVAAPMMGVLTAATVALFVLMRTDLRLSRGEAWFLLLLYGAFLGWISLESVGWTDLVPTLPPN